MIKFKIWDKLMGKFVNVVGHMDFTDKTYVFCQYTNLLDKNNKEIYEGDILKVKYFDGWFDEVGYYGNLVVKRTIIPSGDSDISGFVYIPQDREVIGNIYETPQLHQ